MSNHVDAPGFVSYQPVDRESVRLVWGSVTGADGYEITGGGTDSIRSVKDSSAIVRGLRAGVDSRMRVRTTRGSARSEWITATVRSTPPIPPAPEARPIVDLIDADRQSVQLSLPDINGEDVDCLLRVWWSPSDSGWWASIEIPVNTPAVSSRRLGLNCGLLDHVDHLLAGNFVMRGTGQGEGLNESEPTRRSFVDRTHELRWELRDDG